MNWHQIKSFLSYRLKAKTRHDIHSPFVFDFIEKGLRINGNMPLLQKITGYFSQFPLVIIEDLPNGSMEKLSTLLDNPGNSEMIILVKKIHQDRLYSERWKEIHQHRAVTMSMDLYSYGLLFFRDEFLIKQHFVLKYPA